MRTRRFIKNIKPYLNGKPVYYLEIGVYEGDTIKWMQDKLHKNSRLFGIDPWRFEWAPRRRYPDNANGIVAWNNMINGLRAFQHKSGNVKLIKGLSQDVLCKFKDEFFDIIYVDGHHSTHAVMRDFVLSWPLLKVGGIMVFDDYLMKRTDEVKVAVDAILHGFKPRKRGVFDREAKVEVLFQNSQVGLRKLLP